MILTTCPACAAPLAHDAPRCVRCQTRYCNKTCQLRACAAIAESLFDAAKGVALLEGVVRDARRVLGDEHESVKLFEGGLEDARALERSESCGY